jgi:hypothetical protein
LNESQHRIAEWKTDSFDRRSPPRHFVKVRLQAASSSTIKNQKSAINNFGGA